MKDDLETVQWNSRTVHNSPYLFHEPFNFVGGHVSPEIGVTNSQPPAVFEQWTTE